MIPRTNALGVYQHHHALVHHLLELGTSFNRDRPGTRAMVKWGVPVETLESSNIVVAEALVERVPRRALSSRVHGPGARIRARR